MNSNIKIAATQCSLGTWFVSGIYVYIPYIKEISMMMIIIITYRVINFSTSFLPFWFQSTNNDDHGDNKIM